MKKLLFLLVLLFSQIIYADQIKVVTTFTILGDIVKQIAKDKVIINNLVKADESVHSYDIAIQDILKIKNADIVFINGLNFEPISMFNAVKQNSKKYVVTSNNIIPIKVTSHEHHNHGAFDPHVWQDPNLMIQYAKNITNALVEIDKNNKDFYLKNYNQYVNKLKALDILIKTEINSIPLEKRKILVLHNSFSYFGKRYKVHFISALGLSDEIELSAKDMGNIINTIRKENITAIFMENIKSSKLLKQISRETNVKIIGALYSDALSNANGPTNTYIKLMEYNVKLIVNALK